MKKPFKIVVRIIKISAISLFYGIIVFLISIPIVNNITANNIETELLNIPTPQNTEVVDSLSKAAKLVGSGNGMQYLGAILIKSDLSATELYEHYKAFDNSVCVEPQHDKQLAFVDIGNLEFDAELLPSECYYVIYNWGNGIGIYEDIDLRGH